MATDEEFLQSDHKSVANSEEVREDDATSDSEKRERDTAEWIGRPRRPPSSNDDEEAEGRKKMSVPLNPEQNTTPLLTNTRKVVSTTRNTTAKTLGSRIKKTPRKNLH